MILNDNKIKLRLISDSKKDYKYLEKWYQEEEIYSHFEQRILNYDEIKEKYSKRTSNNSKIPVYMIEYNDIPVGIIQYQVVKKENKKLYKISGNKVYEVDIFIGDLKLHNKGIGSKTVNLMTNYLILEEKADKVVMCPLKENKNAIRCYEKCNYEIKNEFRTEDTIGNIQDYVVMVKK
jgi:aminoglycoside 6'-N-acetyltransferase